MTIPGGTSRMLTNLPDAFEKSDPDGVTTICTTVRVSTLLPDAGAVYTRVARPLPSVTRLRADRLPKSTSVPLRRISARIDILRFGWPFESNAWMVTFDCEAPSSCSVSGEALICTEVPSVEGPVSDGVSCLLSVQPLRSTSAATNLAYLFTVAIGFNAGSPALVGQSVTRIHSGAPAAYLSAKFQNVTSMLPVALTPRPVWS